MVWNTIYNLKTDLFKDISESEYMYLVHSFLCSTLWINCYTNYEVEYSSALQKNNFTEPNFTQKSGDVGKKKF
jgi:glutamine amidotransferase